MWILEVLKFIVLAHLLLAYPSLLNAAQRGTDISPSDGVIQLHPDSQSVTLNSTVRLQCRVRILVDPQTGAGAQVYWSKNDFGIGGNREDIQEYGRSSRYPYSRYDLPYNLKEGQYDLQITNVELSDEGSYVCQVNFMKNQYLSQTAVLTVQVPSEAPKLVQVMNEGKGQEVEVSSAVPVTVDDGSVLVIKCIARHGKPGAHITWSIDGLPVQPEPDSSGKMNVFRAGFTGNLTTHITPSVSLPRLKDTTSQISARLNKLHHGKLIECRATNPGYGEHSLRPAFTKLEVHYAPVVTIQVRPQRRDNEFMEHDIITVECSAHGRPDTFIWEWFVNGRQIENIADPWYRLRLTRNLHNAIFRCIAISDKKGHAETTVRVKFGPQFVEPSALLFTASLGEDVAMDCPAKGNPTPRIEWRREGRQEVLNRGITFRRDNLREEDFGTYTCTAFTSEFPPVSKQMFIAKRKPPVIQPNPVVHARMGRPARLRCTVNSVPLPPADQRHWYFNNRPVRPDTQHTFEREEFIGGVVLILHIAHVMATDFGHYNCTVQNGFGSDWKLIELSRQEDVPLQFIVGAAVAIGVLIIIGLIFICVCRQRLCGDKYKKGISTQTQYNTAVSRRREASPLIYSTMDQEMHGTIAVPDGSYQSGTHPWFNSPSKPPVSYMRCGSDMDEQRSMLNGQAANSEKMFYQDFHRFGPTAVPVGISTAHCQLVQPFCNGSGYISTIDPRLFNSTNSSIFTACPAMVSNNNIISGSRQSVHDFLTEPLTLQTCRNYEMEGEQCMLTTANGQLINAIPQITTFELANGVPTQLVTHGFYPVDNASERGSVERTEAFPSNPIQDPSETVIGSPTSVNREASRFRSSSGSHQSTDYNLQPELQGVAYVLNEHTTNV